jgi:hypothetical protein
MWISQVQVGGETRVQTCVLSLRHHFSRRDSLMSYLPKHQRSFSRAVVITTAMLFAPIVSAATLYVDINAPGGGDGLSPSTPWNNLQTALTSANSGDTIRIAQGTYKPTTTTDRTVSFVISSKELILEGGWINSSGTWSHSPVTAVTILSGNIGSTGSATDNSYTVLKLSHSSATNSGTQIRHLTIRDGYADNNNDATQRAGGGVRITAGAPRFDYVKITNNVVGASFNSSTSLGAGVYISGASPVFTRCTVENNTMAFDNWGKGAGLYSTGASSVSLIDCTIRNNTKPVRGGGVMASESATNSNSLTMVNCLVTDNAVGVPCTEEPGGPSCPVVEGGGICIEGSSSFAPAASIINCSIVYNESPKQGAGIAVVGASATGTTRTLHNCILWGNQHGIFNGDQIYLGGVGGGTLSVRYSDVQDRTGQGVNVASGTLDWGSPDTSIDSNPLFVSTTTPDYRLQCGSPCINTADATTTVIPADTFDLNANSDTTERTPDLDLNPRIITRADMGAYETQFDRCEADISGPTVGQPDGDVGVPDLLYLITNWGCTSCGIDFAPIPCGNNGNVGVGELLTIINYWGSDCATEDGGSAPATITDCFDVYCAGLSGAAWEDCINKCIEAVCAENPSECE